jgi:hypothetical protein
VSSPVELTDGRGGRGWGRNKIYNCEKAWPSMNHSILSVEGYTYSKYLETRFNKGCVFLYYSSSEFESTLIVYWNEIGAAGPECSVETL